MRWANPGLKLFADSNTGLIGKDFRDQDSLAVNEER